MNETITIHSRKLSIYLQARGFILHGIQRNLKDNRYDVYIFTNSDKLQKAMTDYKEDKKFIMYLNALAREV